MFMFTEKKILSVWSGTPSRITSLGVYNSNHKTKMMKRKIILIFNISYSVYIYHIYILSYITYIYIYHQLQTRYCTWVPHVQCEMLGDMASEICPGNPPWEAGGVCGGRGLSCGFSGASCTVARGLRCHQDATEHHSTWLISSHSTLW